MVLHRSSCDGRTPTRPQPVENTRFVVARRALQVLARARKSSDRRHLRVIRVSSFRSTRSPSTWRRRMCGRPARHSTCRSHSGSSPPPASSNVVTSRISCCSVNCRSTDRFTRRVAFCRSPPRRDAKGSVAFCCRQRMRPRRRSCRDSASLRCHHSSKPYAR